MAGLSLNLHSHSPSLHDRRLCAPPQIGQRRWRTNPLLYSTTTNYYPRTHAHPIINSLRCQSHSNRNVAQVIAGFKGQREPGLYLYLCPEPRKPTFEPSSGPGPGPGLGRLACLLGPAHHSCRSKTERLSPRGHDLLLLEYDDGRTTCQLPSYHHFYGRTRSCFTTT